MNKQIFLISFILIGVIFSCVGLVDAVGTYPAVDPDMVLYYHFNNQSAYGENDTHVYDFSGNGNNGTILGAVWDSTGGILQDGAFVFNKSASTYITTPDSYSLRLNQSNGLSFSFWYKANTLSAQVNFIDKQNGGTTNQGYRLTSNSVGSAFTLQIVNQSSINHGGFPDVTYFNTWKFVTVTISSSGWNFYQDGALISSNNSQLNGLFNSTYALKIGVLFNGSLDEVIIYNKTLSASEIYTNYVNYTSCGSVLSDGCSLKNSITLNGGSYNFSRVINIFSNNIILDGNGSVLYYNKDNLPRVYGFYASNLNNLTIRNLTIINSGLSGSYYDEAFDFFNVSGSSFYYNNFIISNARSSRGILCTNCSTSSFYNNSFSIGADFSNYGHALYFENGLSNNVFSNFINVSGQMSYGVFFHTNSSNNLIYLNSINSINVNNSYCIHADGVGVNNSIYKNNLSMNGGWAIGLEGGASYDHIYNNTIYLNDGGGIILDTGSAHNNVYLNNIYAVSSSYQDLWSAFGLQSAKIGGVSTDSPYNNLYLNNVFAYGTSLNGLFIDDTINYLNFSNNYIATGDDAISSWGTYLNVNSYSNCTFANNILNLSNSSSYAFRFNKTATGGSSYVFTNYSLFNNVIYGINKYVFGNFVNLIINSVSFSFDLFFNGNLDVNSYFMFFHNTNSSNQNINFYSLTSALLTNGTSLCNGSSSNLALNTGQVNITLNPNQDCYVFDNFNKVTSLPALQQVFTNQEINTIYSQLGAIQVNYTYSYNQNNQNGYNGMLNSVQGNIITTVMNFFGITPMIGTILAVVILIIGIALLVFYVRKFNHKETNFNG